ncbi:hypothetical protein ACMFMG_005643 [Clarireedia jacksonii]
MVEQKNKEDATRKGARDTSSSSSGDGTSTAAKGRKIKTPRRKLTDTQTIQDWKDGDEADEADESSDDGRPPDPRSAKRVQPNEKDQAPAPAQVQNLRKGTAPSSSRRSGPKKPVTLRRSNTPLGATSVANQQVTDLPIPQQVVKAKQQEVVVKPKAVAETGKPSNSGSTSRPASPAAAAKKSSLHGLNDKVVPPARVHKPHHVKGTKKDKTDDEPTIPMDIDSSSSGGETDSEIKSLAKRVNSLNIHCSEEEEEKKREKKIAKVKKVARKTAQSKPALVKALENVTPTVHEKDYHIRSWPTTHIEP